MPKRKDSFLSELEDITIEKLKKVDLKEFGRFVIEEALYIALMSDLFLVSGRMKVFQADGVTHNPLYVQRLVITDMIIGLRKMTTGSIPLTNIQPLGWATALLESWEAELGKAETSSDGTVYALALPNHMRMFMVLGLPGMLRIAVQLTRQLIQIAK